MVRISKQQERRSVSPRKRKSPSKKTGALRDKLPLGYKPHQNALEGEFANQGFIPKIS